MSSSGELGVPAADDTIEDYLAIRVIDGVPKIPPVRTGAAGDRHGDAAVAGCLAYEASRADVPEYGWEEVPRGGPARTPDPWGDDDAGAGGQGFGSTGVNLL